MHKSSDGASAPGRAILILKRILESKYILSLIVVCIIFVVAALVPLAFINNSGNRAKSEFTAQISLFSNYWNGVEANFSSEKIETPDEKDMEFCNKRFDELMELCRVDKAVVTEIKMSGSEYVNLKSANAELRLCRKWIQYSGDWNSWLDTCFDMDTGKVFYLYTNGECIYNSSEYSGASPDDVDTKKLAEFIADEMNVKLYHLDSAASDNESLTAVYFDGNEPFKMEIAVTNYKGRLFDVKVICVE